MYHDLQESRVPAETISAEETLGYDDMQNELARQVDLSRCVPAVLTAAANRVSSGASSAYRRLAGIGFMEWRVVCFLAAEGWSSGAELADGIGLDKAAVSRSLKTLMARGLVKTRAAAGRRSESSLTAAGQELRGKVLALALAREEQMLRGLSAKDREKLISMLTLISRNMMQMDGRPGD